MTIHIRDRALLRVVAIRSYSVKTVYESVSVSLIYTIQFIKVFIKVEKPRMFMSWKCIWAEYFLQKSTQLFSAIKNQSF